MKAQILIKGQIGGNFKILSKMSNYESKKDGMFFAFWLNYNSVADAKKDMRNAMRSIKRDDDYPSSRDRINKDATHLTYDSSEAILYKYHKDLKSI
jgi:hypothetical protein